MDGGQTIVVLCRHARTALNAAGRLRGRLDVPLDDVGLREAATLARHLQGNPVAMVISSPLQRAVQTARAITATTGSGLSVDGRLVDRDYGPWAGTAAGEVVARFGSLDAAPGVEPSEQVLARATSALDDLAGRVQPGLVVLVSHDVVIRTVLAALDPTLGPVDTVPQHTARWNLLRRVQDRWVVEQVDHTGPLRTS